MLATASPPARIAAAAPPRPRPPALEVAWASSQDDVSAAQRLRYRVFVEEMGARITVPAGTPAGVDVDRFDEACEHLLVRTAGSDTSPAEVVGTYRVLTPAGARQIGALYTEGEFDIGRLDPLRPRMAELGRSCTAPEWRRGAVILLLWTALAEFMQRSRLDYMIGCASVSVNDGGVHAANLWQTLRTAHLCAPERRVQPRRPLPLDRTDPCADAEPPALMKGYLRCGGKVLGPPALDPDFGVADLPMMLALSDLPSAYRARFIGA